MDLYPGVDLVIGGDATGAVPWRLEVRPGGEAQGVAVHIEGSDAINDDGYGLAVDTVQALYVTGATTSADFPVTSGTYDSGQSGGMDVFVARMHLANNAPPDKITYATYLGAAGDDLDFDVATDTEGHVFITGVTGSAAFPTKTPYDASLGGASDAFVAKPKVSNPPGACYHDHRKRSERGPELACGPSDQQIPGFPQQHTLLHTWRPEQPAAVSRAHHAVI